MATFSQSTVDKGSDSIADFCCSPCLKHKIYQWAAFYCATCLKCYCAKCVTLHGQLFGKHVAYGREDTRKWPVSKEVEDFLQQCDLHKDKPLDVFCNDHSRLCCITCILLHHRQCAKVTLISESVKGPPPDLQQLSRNIKTILEELKKFQNYWDTNMQSLQAAYDKQLHEIRETLDDKLASLKAAVNTEVDHCCKLKNELKKISEAIHDIVDKGKAELTFIASKKCMEKIKLSETYLKENSVKVESSLTFKADSDVLQYLSKLSNLGWIVRNTKAFQVFIMQGKSEYNVRLRSVYQSLYTGPTVFFTKSVWSDLGHLQSDSDKSFIPSDSYKSFINAICVLSDDKILVADTNNRRVKLLNHKYQVVGYCDLTAHPWDMCKITSSEVAVAVNENETHEVQFVFVNGEQLEKGRKLQFQHNCFGIAHNLKDLYLTSGTALYKYSMKGALLSKLYEDTSGNYTGTIWWMYSVFKCAVSPLCDKIFVTNFSHDKVLTLAKNGTVLHTFTDPELQGPRGIHITVHGQVLVCGGGSNTILQLDGEGKKKLATLATRRDGLDAPESVCYNRSTASIIVGALDSHRILVFEVK